MLKQWKDSVHIASFGRKKEKIKYEHQEYETEVGTGKKEKIKNYQEGKERPLIWRSAKYLQSSFKEQLGKKRESRGCASESFFKQGTR